MNKAWTHSCLISWLSAAIFVSVLVLSAKSISETGRLLLWTNGSEYAGGWGSNSNNSFLGAQELTDDNETTDYGRARDKKPQVLQPAQESLKVKDVPLYSAGCDYSDGQWVRDKANQTMYSNCNFISTRWICRKTKRGNFDYEEWRWAPARCRLYRLNAKDFLRRLRNKVVAFLGDSLGQQQFQSLVCGLTAGLGQNPVNVQQEYKRFEEWNSNFKGWAYRFTATNTTVVYIQNTVLCKQESMGDFTALHLDRPEVNLEYLVSMANVLVLNTGYHWNRMKEKKNKWQLYVNGEPLKEEGELGANSSMTIEDARSYSLTAVIGWVDRKLNMMEKQKRPLVVLRTISSRHFMDGEWDSGGHCDDIKEMLTVDQVMARRTYDFQADEAVKHTSHVALLNITYLSEFRGEAHPSKWVPKLSTGQQDCLHWCLPGIPDTWNEILYAYIQRKFSRT